jgi:hypothetical protein
MKNSIFILVLIPISFLTQGYSSYFTGKTINVTTSPEFGVCLMGGATENDNAMRWLLEKANGGDVVVLRSSGSNGYNDYLYSELGVTLNSLETFVITSVEGATNPYVLNKVANAENAVIKLFDMQGRLCYQSVIVNNNNILTKNLHKGIYIIEITTEGRMSKFKLVKE